MIIRVFLLCFFSVFFAYSQHQDKVNFIRGEGFIEPLPREKGIKGTMAYEFEILADVGSIFLDAKNMNINSVYVNAKQSPFVYNDTIITIHRAAFPLRIFIDNGYIFAAT